jgi:hypothetical protein
MAKRLSESQADYLFWLDADAVICNQDFKLESLMSGRGMDISIDCCGVCAGVFGVQNCDWSRGLMSAWWFLKKVDDPENKIAPWLKDQPTLKFLIANFAVVRDRITHIPQTVIANPESKVEHPEFMFHFWGCRYQGKYDALAADMLAYQQQIASQRSA